MAGSRSTRTIGWRTRNGRDFVLGRARRGTRGRAEGHAAHVGRPGELRAALGRVADRRRARRAGRLADQRDRQLPVGRAVRRHERSRRAPTRAATIGRTWSAIRSCRASSAPCSGGSTRTRSVAQPVNTLGDAPAVGAARAARQRRLALSFFKDLAGRQRRRLQLRYEIYNLRNVVELPATRSARSAAPTSGRLQHRQLEPRQMQFAVKLMF